MIKMTESNAMPDITVWLRNTASTMGLPHRDKLNEAADEIERLRESLEWLRATFRLNMIRAYPNMPHEEIDEKIKFVEEYPNRTSLGEG